MNNIPKNLIKVGGKMRIDDGMYLGGWFDRGGIQVEKKEPFLYLRNLYAGIVFKRGVNVVIILLRIL